ncbi:CDP-alcohol phosphatidyltransferase family protein [Jatrophihabitans sp. YIM 134969]
MSSPSGFRAAYARTRSSQKSHVGAPGWSRWVNRPLGRIFAAAAFRVGATPNQVTVLSTLVTLGGVVSIAVFRPTWVTSTGIVVALVLGYALDSADGQLARLRGGGSVAGEWLDHVTDAVKNTGIHLAVLVCVYRHFDVADGWLLVPIGFTLVASVFFFSVILSEQLRKAQGKGSSRRAVTTTGGRAPVLRSLLVLPADYGILCVALVLLPAPTAFLTVYTVLFGFAVFFLVGGLRNWFREMSGFAA